MVLLSEIDPYLNQAIERKDSGLSSNFNFDNYHPRYWLVNGRGFPDSIADNGASWLPNQPYGALAQVREADSLGVDLNHTFGGWKPRRQNDHSRNRRGSICGRRPVPLPRKRNPR